MYEYPAFVYVFPLMSIYQTRVFYMITHESGPLLTASQAKRVPVW